MLKQVDKSETHLIQKVTLPDGTVLRYQTVELGKDGKPNFGERFVTRFGTLRQARVEAGLLEAVQTPKKAKKRGRGKQTGYNATEELDAFQM